MERAGIAVLAAAALYSLLLLLGWLHSPELEDHDSVRYLEWAEVFRSGSWRAIVDMSPDAAPLFPLSTAVLSILPGDLETAARLVSFLSSVFTMLAVCLMAKRIGGSSSAIAAVILLAVVSPAFYRMSFSVMTEPLYIALFTWIAWLSMSTLDRPRPGSSLVLGILAGLAFLTRVEGVLLLLALPLFHLAFAAVNGGRRQAAAAVAPALLLVAAMSALSAPQVARVSALMDTFALNGRSVWPAMLAAPDGKSYNEKLTGLDYDPRVVNLFYLQTHPEAVKDLVAASGRLAFLKDQAKTVVMNIHRLHDSQLALLVGLPALAFSVVGFLTLLRSGRGADALLLAGFMGVALVGPLVYTVTLRHLLILVPFLCVLAARGIVEAGDAIRSLLPDGARWRTPVLAGVLLSATAMPISDVADLLLAPDDFNTEYDEASLQEPAAIVGRFSREHGRPAGMIMRKTYLAWRAGSPSLIMPYTDLEGLLTYIEGRQIDFLFYEQRHLEEYPFVEEIGSDAWQRHFRAVWTNGGQGDVQALYAVR